jgi:acyl carrier protein
VTDLDESLRRCFRATFPDLPLEDIPSASVERVREWDSLHTVILIAVLEEVFDVRIPSHRYPDLRSYASVRDYLREAGFLRDSGGHDWAQGV